MFFTCFRSSNNNLNILKTRQFFCLTTTYKQHVALWYFLTTYSRNETKVYYLLKKWWRWRRRDQLPTIFHFCSELNSENLYYLQCCIIQLYIPSRVLHPFFLLFFKRNVFLKTNRHQNPWSKSSTNQSLGRQTRNRKKRRCKG